MSPFYGCQKNKEYETINNSFYNLSSLLNHPDKIVRFLGKSVRHLFRSQNNQAYPLTRDDQSGPGTKICFWTGPRPKIFSRRDRDRKWLVPLMSTIDPIVAVTVTTTDIDPVFDFPIWNYCCAVQEKHRFDYIWIYYTRSEWMFLLCWEFDPCARTVNWIATGCLNYYLSAMKNNTNRKKTELVSYSINLCLYTEILIMMSLVQLLQSINKSVLQSYSQDILLSLLYVGKYWPFKIAI